MLFNSVVFLFAFLPITYVVFWLLRSTRARYIWLAVTGYVFYAYWDARFCLLMLFSTLVSYGAGLAMLRWDNDARRRKLCMVIPIIVDLSLLGFFKYTNFVLDTATDTLHSAARKLRFKFRVEALDDAGRTREYVNRFRLKCHPRPPFGRS